jgi:hypothetical protein
MKQINFKEIEDAIWNEPAVSYAGGALKDIYQTRDYTEALQLALYKQQDKKLIELLDRQVPIHPLQLPILAAVLKQNNLPKKSGTKVKLTPQEKIYIHRLVALEAMKTSETLDAVFLALASVDNLLPNIGTLSDSTIRRAFNEVDKNLFQNRFKNYINRKSDPSDS